MKKVLPAQQIGPASCRPPVLHDSRGAVAVIVAIVIVVLFSFAALALDISNAMIARNELQNVADASALAGARQLGLIYQALPQGTPYTTYVLSDPSAVVTAATAVALQNRARQVAISLNAADIVIGVWNSGPRTLTPGNVGVTGVRVTARRDGGANGPVATWLAGIMGINSMNVVATATAALTGAGSVIPPEVPPPFSISELFFTPGYCGRKINFSPTTTSCAAWHTFDQQPPNANTVRDILQGMTPPNTPNPPIPVVSVGDSLNYIGGELGNAAWPSLVKLYQAKRVNAPSKPAGVPDAEWTGKCWYVSIPVYDENDTSCGNPSGAMSTVGFATGCVYDVINNPPTRDIRAALVCNEVTTGGGGGGDFGTLGSIPGLVE